MVNRFLPIKSRIVLVVMVLLGFFSSGGCSPVAREIHNPERRHRCVEILQTAMEEGDGLHLKMRAAEALLWNAYDEGVDEYFADLEKSVTDSLSGVFFIRAIANKKNLSLYHEFLERIFREFLHGGPGERIFALECLCRLGFDERQPEIVRIADEDEGREMVFARWILANSGSAEDLDSLTALLTSPEPAEYSSAAYALRSIHGDLPRVADELRSCYVRLRSETGGNVYVTSALFVHSPGEAGRAVKEDLYGFSRGETHERMEVCEALAERGRRADIPLLETLLSDPEEAVMIRAANALLRIERRGQEGLVPVDWLVIGFYILLMLSIGMYYFRRQKTSEEYLLGNRHVNSLASGISLFASFLSTITFLAIAGETIKHGPLVVGVYIFCLPIVYFLAAYFVIPFFMKMRITSAYEIIEKPFGKGVRMTGSIIFLLTRFVWMALLVFLTAKTLVVMLNWNEGNIIYISILCGIITVIYATMGGLRAVVVTDVTQFSILMFGAILTLVLVTAELGGVSAWMPVEWAPNWDRIIIFSLDPYLRLTVVFLILNRVSYWVCTAGSDQMAIQRFVATKDLRSARRSFLTAQSVETVLFCILMCVGFAIFSFYRENPHLLPDGKDLTVDADFLFPNFIANNMPAGISGLMVAALFSAAMSSLSSGINSTAAVVTADIVPWITGRNRDNTKNLSLAKWSSFVVGMLVVGISSSMQDVPGNIMEVTAKTSNFFVSPLFNLFFMAFFVPFATPFGTIIGSIYGIAAAFILSFWDVMTGGPPITFLWIVPGSLIVSIMSSVVLSFIPVTGKRVPVHIIWTCVVLIPVVVLLVYIWNM